MIIGVAGKACSGKDTVLTYFTDRGFDVIDADRVGHDALDANREAVLRRFGTVDRSELGKIVFSRAEALADLEAITHPWISSEIRRRVAELKGDIVINAALLHKQALYQLCDRIVWVDAPVCRRIVRARHRDGWGWMRILNRIWAQRKLGPQAFPQGVDILRVDNRGSIADLHQALETRLGRAGTFSA